MGEILSAEEVRSERYRYPDSTTEDGANDVIALCESHEALRRERDATDDAKHRIAMATHEGESDDDVPWDNLATGVESLRSEWIDQFQRAERAEAEVTRLREALVAALTLEWRGFNAAKIRREAHAALSAPKEDRCPRCGSDDKAHRKMHGVDQDPDAFLCSDPWHSAPKEDR